jgi:hypothetical protein
MNQEDRIKELENKYKFERLEKQLFIGKVIEIIGSEKATELLIESKQAIEQLKKL